jgi:hypothetical protein
VARWRNSEQDDVNIVASLSNITSVGWGGYRNYLALKTDGTVVGFRSDAPDTDKHAGLIRPLRVHGQILSNIIAVVSMGYIPPVLKSDGAVFSLGYQTPGVPPVEPRYELAGGSGRTAFQPLFDLAPQVFSRVEVRRIRRQILQPRPGGLNDFPDARDLVRGWIVQDDHIIALQHRCQPLFHQAKNSSPSIGPSNSQGACGP